MVPEGGDLAVADLVYEREARVVAHCDLIRGVGIRGEDDRDAPLVKHFEKFPSRIDLAYRLPESGGVHIDDDAGLGDGISGLLQDRRDVPVREVAEDLYEVRVTQDLEPPGERSLADVRVVRGVEVVGLVSVVDTLVRGPVHLLVVHPVYAADDVIIREGRGVVFHAFLGTRYVVYLDPEAQLHVVRELAGLLKSGEVYLFEVAVMLGDAHLANASRPGDFAVFQYVLHGHRTVAVGYDVQVVVDQMLLSRSRHSRLTHLIRYSSCLSAGDARGSLIVRQNSLRRNGSAHGGCGGGRASARPDAPDLRRHCPGPDRPGLGPRAGYREPWPSLRPAHRRHPQRHLRQRCRTHNNHLRTLRRTHDRGEGFDHRFDHR